MSVFESADYDNHEQVVFNGDARSGLRLIIAIYNTALGPAIGGLRFWPYSSDDVALTDVLRLSKGMAYKAAIAGVPFGGGKAVVICDSPRQKSIDLLHAVGAAIERLGGRYVTGEDVGSTVDDMVRIHDVTEHVMGTPPAMGGSGDPSSNTALGCYYGILACARHALNTDNLKGLRVAVQGLGNVGSNLCRMLTEQGAKLIVTDLRKERATEIASETGAMVVDPEEIYGVNADIFSPCALGSTLSKKTVEKLRVRIVAGGANNQLAEDDIGLLLRRRGILYAPDYVINGGGMIQLAVERLAYIGGTTYDSKDVTPRVAAIYDTLLEIFRRADREDIPSNEAADHLAESRMHSSAPKTSAYAN